METSVFTSNGNFPLAAILYLYDKCYGTYILTEYDHEPFKRLVEWLGPIDIPYVKYRSLKWYEKNWVTGRLAEILNCPEHTIVSTLIDIERNKGTSHE